MATAPPLPRFARGRLLTSEEFLDWLQPGIFADLIGGEIFMRSPVNIRHARLVNFLDHLLRSYLEEERRFFGKEPFYQGFKENYNDVANLIKFAGQQGMLGRDLTVEELFTENTRMS